ncbi:MAG TPA: ComF family protein [Anaerolineaceae bacterium]|nr:ComF family protein [Anaerolineaceae bacterium]
MPQAGLQDNPAFALYQIVWKTLDWLYPPVCGGCGKLGWRWCSECRAQVTQLEEWQICRLCGNLLLGGDICAQCQQQLPPYQALRSWGVFSGPLRKAIHRLKYGRDVGLGEALAQPLLERLINLNWPINLITAIPLNKNRLKQRGYNQAGLLARPLALGCKLPYTPRAIQRIKDTPTQVGLSAPQRQENVRGVFCAFPKLVMDRTVLLVDDVTTSGSTMRECAHSLLEAGAAAVYGLTLARPVLPAAQERPTEFPEYA